MPKRSCPFDSEYNINPVKKQITDESGTVAMVSKMRMIYDRTMRMLFEGANAPQVPNSSSHVHQELMDQDVSRYRQTFLDSRCRLQSKNAAVAQQGTIQIDTSMSCNFCDKRLENGLSKECSKCRETFCHLCSSESFNNFSDQFVCLGCG